MANTASRSQQGRARAERLETRVSAEQKSLIERAAALQGRTLTDFVLTSVQEAAIRAIAEHETLVLSERDRLVFFDTLVNPPAPSERLQRALAEHKHRVVP